MNPKEIKGVVIKPDCTREEVKFKHLTDYQRAVDGFIEAVRFYNYNGEEIACAYVDDDGIAKKLPLNPLGSAISFLFGNTPYLFGNIIIVGKSDAEGYDTDIPEFIATLVNNICATSNIEV